MAVAVKNTPETTHPRLLNHLAVESLLGSMYFIGSMIAIFAVLPGVWWWAWAHLGLGPESGIWANHGSYAAVGWALLLILIAGAGYLLGVLGMRLAGSSPVHGLSAGIFFGVLGFLLAFVLTCSIGSALFEPYLGTSNSGLGIAITVVLGLAMVAGLLYLFMIPKVEGWLVLVEDQGWFSATAYKRSQGQRVRRGTILGILILAGCGIITLYMHGALKGDQQEWLIPLPFSGGWYWPILIAIRITVPLLLTGGAFWLAYRVVNFPTFADFLIATEAEMNKVSWTTRKRLIQDTVVVLVTVVLLTVFLFVVDQIWAQVLTKVGVIQVQRSNYIRVEQAGDSPFKAGIVIPRATFDIYQTRLKGEGKQQMSGSPAPEPTEKEIPW